MRASAGSKPKTEGQAVLPTTRNASTMIIDLPGGMRPRDGQLLTADTPTPQSAATFAGPPSASITSPMVESMDASYSRFVESSSFHVSEIATSCEQWLNSGMISEREFETMAGYRLMLLRRAFGKSQKEFGTKMGVGGTAVSNYEAGRAVEPYKALKLKEAFGAPLEWLYSGDESALSDHLAERLSKAEKAIASESKGSQPRHTVKTKARG